MHGEHGGVDRGGGDGPNRVTSEGLALKEGAERNNHRLDLGGEGWLGRRGRTQRRLPPPPALVGIHNGEALHVRLLGLRGGTCEEGDAVNPLQKGRRGAVGDIRGGGSFCHIGG